MIALRVQVIAESGGLQTGGINTRIDAAMIDTLHGTTGVIRGATMIEEEVEDWEVRMTDMITTIQVVTMESNTRAAVA